MVSVVLRSVPKPYAAGLLPLAVRDPHLRDHSSLRKEEEKEKWEPVRLFSG